MKLKAISTQIKTDILSHSYLHIISVYILYRDVYVITPDEENDMLDLGGIEVVFDVYSRLDTVIVPQKAVKKLDGRNYVNLLVDGVKIEQDVELGIEDNDNVEILSGLSGGEEIILN